MCLCVLGGLVQRGGGGGGSSTQSEASGYAAGAVGGDVELDMPDKDSAGYADDGGDSKAMRLTLMEEVLLLGLKDREVGRCDYNCCLHTLVSFPRPVYFRLR